MALHALRASRTLAGRRLLAHRPVTAPALFPVNKPSLVPHSAGIQSRNFQLPSWIWPFGGDAVSEAAAATPELPIEPEPEPLEVVTGFTRDGAFVPVNTDLGDFSTAAQWTADALTPSLDAFGLGCYWTPVGWVQHLFVYLTDSLHFPVITSLFGLVLLLRLPSIPFYVRAKRGQADMTASQDKFKQARKDFEYYTSINAVDKANRARVEVMRFQKAGLKAMVPLLMQFPIMFVFYGVRRMAMADYCMLANGHFLWLPTLTAPDPYFLLPILSTGMVMGLIMTNSEMGASALLNSPKRVFVYGSLSVTGIIMCFLPAASVMVVVMNSSITMMLSLTLKLKPVARFFDLPERPTVEAAPSAVVAKRTPLTVAGISERISTIRPDVSKIPALSEFMSDRKNKQFTQNYKDEEREKLVHFRQQMKDAARGKLKVER